MKLLICVKDNINRWITNKSVFAIFLLISLIVSTFTFTVFYALCARTSAGLSEFNGINRNIDLNITNDSVIDSSIIDNINKYVDDVVFTGVADTNVGIIGIDSNSTVFVVLLDGEWVSNSCAVIPIGYYNNAKNGDTITIDGNNFIVSGRYLPSSYTASDFLPQDSELTGYPTFICMEDFEKLNLHSDFLRIRVLNEVTVSQKMNYLQQIFSSKSSKYSLSQESLENERRIYASDFIEKLALYLLIIILSMVNILQIFKMYIENNKFQYNTYLICGAEKRDIHLIVLIETSIYMTVAFLIGCSIGKIYVQNTSISFVESYLTVKLFFLMWIFFVLITAIASWVFLHKTILSSKKKYSKEKIKKYKSKILYLLRHNFSQSLWRELSLCVQIIFISFVFVYTVTYIFDSTSSFRAISRIFTDDNIMCFAYQPGMLGVDENALDGLEYSEIKTELEKLDGINAVGTVQQTSMRCPTIEPSEHGIISFMPKLIDPAILERTCFNIKGVWLNEWSEGIELTDCEYVPIVATEAFLDYYNMSLGKVYDNFYLTKYVDSGSYVYTEVAEGLYTTTFEGEYEFKVKIVGILQNGDRMLELGGYPLNNNNILSIVDDETIKSYAPMLYINNIPVSADYKANYHYLVFGDIYRIDEYRNIMRYSGELKSVHEIAKEYDSRVFESIQFRLTELLASILLFFICIIGYSLISYYERRKAYDIYIQCGMSQSQIFKLISASNLLICLPGNILGTILTIYLVLKTRELDSYSIILSCLSSTLLVLLLYIISTMIIIIRIRRYSPSELHTVSK